MRGCGCRLRQFVMKPRHMSVAIRRKLSTVVVVRREMLMNLRLGVVCISVVPMLEWQSR